MPTMQTFAGSIVPPRCLACLLLVLCLLPVAVPASGEGRAPGAVSGAGEARGLKEQSFTAAERRPAERQAVRAAESEKFAADLLADMAALDPQKEPTETPGESGMPNGGKAAPAKTGGHGPACAAAAAAVRPPAVSRAEQYEEWKRQRRRRGDKTE